MFFHLAASIGSMLCLILSTYGDAIHPREDSVQIFFLHKIQHLMLEAGNPISDTKEDTGKLVQAIASLNTVYGHSSL